MRLPLGSRKLPFPCIDSRVAAWTPLRSRLLFQSEQDAATLERQSHVEDPGSALKDGRRVGRQLGPHQMFLRKNDKVDRQVHEWMGCGWSGWNGRRQLPGFTTGPVKWDETVAATLSESIGLDCGALSVPGQSGGQIWLLCLRCGGKQDRCFPLCLSYCGRQWGNTRSFQATCSLSVFLNYQQNFQRQMSLGIFFYYCDLVRISKLPSLTEIVSW